MQIKDLLKTHKEFVVMLIIVIAFFAIVFIRQDAKVSINITDNQIIEKKVADYQPILDSIEAKSFYVYDILNDKSLFSKDEHLKLPLASITKLMSGLVVLDVMPDTAIITINNDDIEMEGDSGLVIGEKWKLKDLLDFSLISSSNDGMHAIASLLDNYEIMNGENTVKMMNEKAKKLGLDDTVFINETGLDVNDNMSGAYSSAYDISLLLKDILKNNPGLISSTNQQTENFVSESNVKHTATNTNESINDIPNMISSKTGFTNLAGGNLAIMFDAGVMHPIIIVILGSTVDGRFTDIVKLAKISLEKLSE